MKLAAIAEATRKTMTDKGFDTAVAKREKTSKTDISKLLGFNEPLKQYARGTFATIYQHPTEENLLIKVTAHKDDIQNSVRAQRLNSPNIVKLYQWPSGKLYQEIPELKTYAIIPQKVVGQPIEYATNALFTIAYNGSYDKAKDWLLAGGSPPQNKMLEKYGKNNDDEKYKLADLFKALHGLERIGIHLSDLDQNIIDDGTKYVIIDLGF